MRIFVQYGKCKYEVKKIIFNAEGENIHGNIKWENSVYIFTW